MSYLDPRKVWVLLLLQTVRERVSGDNLIFDVDES